MRKFLVPFLVLLCFAACKDSSTNTAAPATAGNDSAVAAAVPLPYTAIYSSNFVPGKQVDVATVLDSYKAWEINDMKAMRATFSDSITMVFPDGTKVYGTSDSIVKTAGTFRDSLSKVVLTFYAWTANHSVDKNEDWVNLWYKEVDTYKKGKVDSTEYEDDNLLKNGKIVYTSSHSQKYKKK
jgi:hypothetical protein